MGRTLGPWAQMQVRERSGLRSRSQVCAEWSSVAPGFPGDHSARNILAPSLVQCSLES